MLFKIGDQIRTWVGEDGWISAVLGGEMYAVMSHDNNHLGYYTEASLEPAPRLKVELVHENAKVPTYGDGYAAGMDIYSPESFTIPPRSKVNAKSGIKLHIPSGHWVEVKARSGTSWKNCIEIGAGVIDQNYRGELGVVMYNNSDVPYHVVAGDRIAQMVLAKFERANIMQVDSVEETGRGAYGSTGK